MKKSYNPFKMWGPLVGALIGVMYSAIALNYFLPDIFDILIKLGMKNIVVGTGIINFPFAMFSTGIIGFLIGWGIHSLCRRLK